MGSPRCAHSFRRGSRGRRTGRPPRPSRWRSALMSAPSAVEPARVHGVPPIDRLSMGTGRRAASAPGRSPQRRCAAPGAEQAGSGDPVPYTTGRPFGALGEPGVRPRRGAGARRVSVLGALGWPDMPGPGRNGRAGCRRRPRTERPRRVLGTALLRRRVPRAAARGYGAGRGDRGDRGNGRACRRPAWCVLMDIGLCTRLKGLGTPFRPGRGLHPGVEKIFPPLA